MAKLSTLEVKINLCDIEPVKSLIDALEANIDELPAEVYAALQILVDSINEDE